MTDQKLEQELQEVLEQCRKLIKTKPSIGALTFHPAPEDVHLYEELVKRKLMVRDPLEDGGYMFSRDYKRVYKEDGYSHEDIVTVKDGG